jgi:Flp pilus assembly pilin Flp
MPVFKELTRNRSKAMLSIINDTTFRFFVMLKTDRKAAGALEYALLTGLIAVAVITAVGKFGTGLSTYFDTLTTHIPTGTPK